MSVFERLKMILFGALARALRVLLPKSAKNREGKKKKKKSERNEEIDAKGKEA